MSGTFNVTCRQVRRWLLRQGYQPAPASGHPKFVRPDRPPVRLTTTVTAPLTYEQADRLARAHGYPSARALATAIQQGR